VSDRLYFEPLAPEYVLSVLAKEKPDGVMVQFGGQSAIKLAKPVADAGYPVLGTQPKQIHRAEDRKEFDALLGELGIPRPAGGTAFTTAEAVATAEKLGYPVLVRPSYVLGGQGMEIAYQSRDVAEYMEIITRVKQEHPVLIDKYITGREIEVDAVCDGEDILIPGIMEHIERTGIHSGDSISVYPAVNVSPAVIDTVVDYTRKLALALEIKGLINIQFIEHREEVFVIEVNPRASRTVPYLSKVTGIPIIALATRVMLGEKLKDLGYGTGLYPAKNLVAVKVPVFSLDKLPLVEVSLGPEMKSTGEVLGVAGDLPEALYKGLLAAGCNFPEQGTVLVTVADVYKEEAVEVAREFAALGFKLLATQGTARALESRGVPVQVINKLSQPSYNIGDALREGVINIIVNTPTHGRIPQRDGFRLRRMAVESSVPCFTSLDTVKAFLSSLRLYRQGKKPGIVCLNDLS
ncbi:MAG TPA: ATP-grasp domain-containing protein, partial [Clostridia bacterium]|nr:ATP-grasp domain-containing protein [Clostridia bacterium]